MDILNMSDLQISLIIIGIIIIIGVAVFNWVQQLRYRRKIESVMDHKHEDALLDNSNSSQLSNKAYENTHTRIEPQLDRNLFVKNSTTNEISTQSTPTKTTADIIKSEENSGDTGNNAQESVFAESLPVIEEYDSMSHYIVDIKADTTIPRAQLSELLQRKFDFNKPLTWLGQKEKTGPWENITTANLDHADYVNLRGCLLLADRSGPIREIDLSKFRDTVIDFAGQINATTECPDIVPSHEQAMMLDKFCADVDVMIGINIISKDNGAFVGTKIRALAEASGFKLEPDGMFKYRNDEGHVLFSLTNYESKAFLPDNMKTLTTHGVTFLLDVPRVADGKKVFDQMTHLAKIFSNTLGGIVVDDNRVPLSENGLARSKQQLINIQSLMKEHNISAGSPSALRLFN